MQQESDRCGTINFEAVPRFVRDDLAEATLKAVKAFIAMPGGKELLDNKINAKKKAAFAAKKEKEQK